MVNIAALDTLLPKRHWSRSVLEGVTLYQSGMLRYMPGLLHGFTGRHGGVSDKPYGTLNLGDHVGDQPLNVAENRSRVATAFGFSTSSVVTAEQVHGSVVALVNGPDGQIAGADALVTKSTEVLLMLLFADCVPVFVFDPINRAIGLIHSGWKGTDENIVKKTVTFMSDQFGSDPRKCLAAIGPCIGFEHYEVGMDVAERFRNSAGGLDSGAAQVVMPFNELRGTYLVNLRHVVFQQLISSGYKIESVAVSDQCTYSNSKDFFSHRRDGGQGKHTGRMAGIMGLLPRTRSRGIS